MNKILITPKINPDLDGVACAYAYAKLLSKIDPNNNYTAGIYGKAQIEAEFLLKSFTIKDTLIFDPKMDFDKFIIVDASDIKGMPTIIKTPDVTEVIDHRQAHRAEELFPNAHIQIDLVGAAATLIFENFQNKGVELDINSTILLYGAIFSNTLNLQTNVSDRDQQAISLLETKLKKEINNPGAIIEKMFETKTEYISKNLVECIKNDFKSFESGLGIAQLEGPNLDKLIGERSAEIRKILLVIKNELKLKHVFLTAADTKNAYNIFIAADDGTKKFLSESLSLLFDKNGIAKNNKLYLRKQIVPMLNKSIYA